MSDGPIQVGDLVMVMRWPCCGGGLGHIMRVVSISDDREKYKRAHCSLCGVSDQLTLCAYGDDGWRVPVNRLKRIDPRAEDETVTTEEGVTA